MKARGTPLRAMRAAIDEKWGASGPATHTPLPPA